MDDLNYRRLVARPKQRCAACGATSYQDPAGVFRCVVCNHDFFDMCLDCGSLRGWCECPPPVPAAKSGGKRGSRRERATATRRK